MAIPKPWIVVDRTGNPISCHNKLEFANRKLRAIDSVKYAVYAHDDDEDARHLVGTQQALQGYKYRVVHS